LLTMKPSTRPKKLFKIFPVISHFNNKLQELHLPNQDISTMNHWCFGKTVCLSNSTSI
jgi:hypothetical protein